MEDTVYFIPLICLRKIQYNVYHGYYPINDPQEGFCLLKLEVRNLQYIILNKCRKILRPVVTKPLELQTSKAGIQESAYIQSVLNSILHSYATILYFLTLLHHSVSLLEKRLTR